MLPLTRRSSKAPLSLVIPVACLLLLLGLQLVAQSGRTSPALLGARGMLVLVVVSALAWGWRLRVSAAPALRLTERLQIASRARLSDKCSLALVEVDGQPFLIAFGDGFAQPVQLPRSPWSERGPHPDRCVP